MTSLANPHAALRPEASLSPHSPGPRSLHRQFSQLPVTALCFASLDKRNLLLAAEDTAVKVYDVPGLEVLAHVDVFAEQTVHGISVCEERVLVWGNRYVASFKLDSPRSQVEDARIEVLRVDAPDWVYDGKISPFDSSVAVLATAHNEVVRLTIDEKARRMDVQEVISPARPNLYSAEVTWLDASSVLMAAGTAFGEILVWKCHLSNSGSTHEMLFVLTGHEGSIYGVCVSPPLTLPGVTEPVRLLASCSDDRTVRIWDVTERQTEKQKYDFVSARETGFSEILSNANKPKLEGGEPVAVSMGHLSRIWGVEIGEMNADGKVDVWTFGEDSTTWRWTLSLEGGGGERVEGRLTCEKVLSYHDGKHLWSHAKTKIEGQNLLATGGADGRISLIETESSSAPSAGMVTLDCQQLCPKTVLETKTKKAEVFGRFEFISEDQLLVVTSTGRLLLGTYKQHGLEWTPIIVEGLQDEIRQCYVLKRITAGTAIMGTTTGNLYFFKENTLSLIEKLPRKIVDVKLLTTTDSTADILIHIFGTACPYYFVLNTQTGHILSKRTVSGLDDRFVCTSAGLIGSLLILGSRHGWISLLEQQDDDTFSQTHTFLSPTRDAITSIVPLPVSPDFTPSLFLCTSRDGSYRIYTLHQQEVRLVHHSSLPFGPMVETAFFTSHSPSPQLILAGFRGTNFIVWNETLREERLSVDCGGAHRSFSFFHDFTDEAVLRFAFNRAAKLSVHSQAHPEARPVKRGTHGREIRSVSFDGRYIATGGEDTTIRIYEGHPQSRCLASLKGHVSGLQKVQWLDRKTSSQDHILFSSAGNEEFFVWRVKLLAGTTYPGLGILREAVFEDKSPDGDLRIMDFDLEQIPDAQGSSERSAVIITMVFSSSALARYTYHPTTGFKLLARGRYTGSCLTQVKHLSGEAVLTASTDGYLAVWSVDEQRKTFLLRQVLRVHQSSVKCLDVVTPLGDPAGEVRYVVTGGDDNALGVTMLTEGLCLEHCGVVRRAHAASINGLLTRLLPDGVEITTVSNDQRIKTWTFDFDERKIRLLGNGYSGVADPGDVEELGVGRIGVTGVGVEVWGRRERGL